jgi:sigma-B regulation protein RsbU (phosphoserine phosphatase)
MAKASAADSFTIAISPIKGRAYSGVRNKLNQAMLALGISEVSRSLVTAEFSFLYRLLPIDTTIQLTILLQGGKIRIGFDVSISVLIADQLASGIAYLKCCRTPTGHSGERLEAWRDFKATADSSFVTAAEILSLKTFEEIENEAESAQQELGTTQVKLQTVQDDLQAAADIQGHMLLSNEQLRAISKKLDCHSYIVPCRDIGGDLYDCIAISESCFALAIGDVSGKGVPAALMMATCITLIRAYVESHRSPAEIINKINQRLVRGNEDDCMFTTLTLVIIDADKGCLTYCNAGHNPGIILHPDGSSACLDVVHGPAVGIFEHLAYSEQCLGFGPGDQLLLYTDGVSEAFNKQGEIYGHQRILNYCQRATCSLGSRRLLGGLLLDINIFSEGEHAHDDVTMLAVRLLTHSYSLRLEIAASCDECSDLKKSIEACCQEWKIPSSTTARVLLVLDELLSNVVLHANAGDGAQPRIVVQLCQHDQTLQLELRDSSPAYNPDQAPVPDTDLDLEARSIGGLGLLLVKSMVDSFSYVYDSPWNCVVLELSCRLDGLS